MSMLSRIQSHGITHAVLRNEAAGISDWFILCRKSQLRKVYITTHGIYEQDKIQMYILNMTKDDVLHFYSSLQSGVYAEVFNGLEGTVWEEKGCSLRNAIKRSPYKKPKKL